MLLLNARTDINANQQAEYWLEHVRAFGRDAPVLLVGNKSDLAQVNLDLNRLTEAYPNIRGFFAVSCTKPSGIEAFRDALAKQLRAVGMAQAQFARSHFAVLDALRALSPKDPFLPKQAFEALCADNGVTEDAELNREWLLDLLDKLGVIIHFPSMEWLDDYILNPRWLTYGVYQLLYSPLAREQQGRISEHNVPDILCDQEIEDNEGNRLNEVLMALPKDKYRQPEQSPPRRTHSAWSNGLFYLLTFVVVMATLAVMANWVSWVALPVLLIGGLLAVGVIGALQMRNDERLTQKNFLELMLETYKRLPLLRGNQK